MRARVFFRRGAWALAASLLTAGCGPSVQVVRHGAAHAPRDEKCAVPFDAALDPQTVALRYELLGQIVVSGAQPGAPAARELVRAAACRLGGQRIVPGAALGGAGGESAVYLVLGRARAQGWTIGDALRTDSAGVLAVARSSAEERGNVVAVFDVNDRAGLLSAAQREQLSEYLAGRLAQQPGMRIAPRARVREQLGAQRKASYRDCYATACQIEVGRALAAQKSLSTQLLQLGGGCALSASLYDLRSEASEQAATVQCSCAAGEQLFACVDQLVRELVGR